jgi:hypothetical protein
MVSVSLVLMPPHFDMWFDPVVIVASGLSPVSVSKVIDLRSSRRQITFRQGDI